ncbi:hypothetical protein M0R45_012615 [Rubus argutus]|uniref:Response regulatory domain-containing protein n=1 Tax=Rubus argutus TaxID=59490 RepID=A0AAW1YF18_RUBAR
MTDVDMPDIDGFKFLQLVRYVDKDLPVILLSTSGDTKVVMKGISNGACDYLLKPVRVEQLKLIWQHVFRRRTKDSKTSSLTPAGLLLCLSRPSFNQKKTQAKR